MYVARIKGIIILMDVLYDFSVHFMGDFLL